MKLNFLIFLTIIHFHRKVYKLFTFISHMQSENPFNALVERW